MAYTREQLEQAIKNLNAKANDPALSSLDRSKAKADLVTLSVEWKRLGSAPASQPLTEAASPETTNYYADRLKVGFTDWISRLLPEGADRAVFDYDYPTSDEATQGGGYIREIERRRMEAVQQKAQEWFGAGAPRTPADNLQRYAGIAVESIASDPIMSVLGGRGVLGVAGNLVGSGVSGVTGAIAYDVASETANSLGASPETQRMVGELAANAAGVGAFALGAKVSGLTGIGTNSARILLENRQIQKNLDSASDYIVSGNMRQVIDDIVSADPKIDTHIEAIRNISKLVPQFKVAPGIALYDNAVVRKNMETLIKESPQFRASVEASLKDLGNAIRARQTALFGTAANADVVRNVTKAYGNYGVKLNNVTRRIDNIDTAMDTLVNKVRTSADPLDIGTAASNLMGAKEKALREKNSIEYEQLLTKYTEAGLDFPAPSVQRLHEFVGGATAEKLFTPFPSLVGKLRTLLSPQVPQQREVTPSVGDLLTGRRTGVQADWATSAAPQYQSITLRQLDSLKQELNKAIRQAEGSVALGNSLPTLNALKSALKTEIEAIPEFGKAYRAIDESFYRDLGIPFDTAGLSQLDSLKFNETVGSYLSKPERARDFISFVGESGLPVVKDAILLRMRNKAFSPDGTFKPDGYAKFIRENGSVIDVVPGLRAELNDISSSISQMDAVKTRLDTQSKQADAAQADSFMRAVSEKGLNAAITDMLVRPEKLINYTRTLKNLDPESATSVRRGIQTALVNRAFDSPEGASAFIDKNPDVFTAFFGPKYINNVKALTDAYDIVRRIDPSRMTFAFSYKEADALQKTTGSSMPQVGSILRDRITSTTQKLLILLSRWFTKRTASRRDDDMINLMTSPEALDRLASTAKAYKDNYIDKNKFGEIITYQLPLIFTRASEATERGAKIEQRTPAAAP